MRLTGTSFTLDLDVEAGIEWRVCCGVIVVKQHVDLNAPQSSFHFRLYYLNLVGSQKGRSNVPLGGASTGMLLKLDLVSVAHSWVLPPKLLVKYLRHDILLFFFFTIFTLISFLVIVFEFF